MKKNDKFDTKAFVGKLISGGEEPQQKPGKRSHIPFRLNLLFLVIFGLFVALIARLGYVQIIEASSIEAQVDTSDTVEITQSSPRGMIYDANGNVLAANVANKAITYTRGNNVSSASVLTIAQRVANLIYVPVDADLTERDLKDYFLANSDNYDAVVASMTDAEKQDENGDELGTSEMYAAVVAKVSAEQIVFSDEELEIATIFTKMNEASALNTIFIKNADVSDAEVAIIAENEAELDGVSTGTDWARQYTDNANIRGLLGNLQDGLLADTAEQYLSEGYLLTDRVGNSNLELQYENVLQGTKSKYTVNLNSDGSIESRTQTEAGSKGNNLMLTIDSDFQNQVQSIVETTFNSIAGSTGLYSPGAYVVVMDPDDGSVLAMAGVSHEEETTTTSADITGTYLNQFVPGSTVKPATVASAYENDLISGNQTLVDQPIRLAGTASKSSWFNKSSTMNITTEQALEYSSNSYMMQLALKMMGLEYTSGMSLPYANSDTQENAYAKLRATYAAFGMGVSTGLDLPNENTGYVPTNFEDIDAGNILDLSFGQFDTYTAMQLAQYVSTVHNYGNRVQAHVVDGVYGNDASGNIDTNNLIQDLGGNSLSQISDLSQAEWDIIDTGMYNAVHGSSSLTTVRALQASPVTAYAKSGTAETEYITANGTTVNTDNSNLVVYTRTDDGNDIAISVILPQLTNAGGENTSIALQILNAYYNSES
ncbi:penicillin-binding transpeptidase domain-containing protein [Enterococcus sp. LJL120]